MRLCTPFTNIFNMPTYLPLTIATKINRTSRSLAISKAVEILFKIRLDIIRLHFTKFFLRQENFEDTLMSLIVL